MKRTPKLGLASVGLVAAAVVVAGAGANVRNSDAVVAKPAPFTVTSTLKGKELLPHRIRWVASPSLPAAQLRDVEFIIDGGRPKWIEKLAPYTYGEDENGRHQNYLVTTLADPGPPPLIVRATAVDGRRAEQTVLARVLPAPRHRGARGNVDATSRTQAQRPPREVQETQPTPTHRPGPTRS